MGKNKPAGTSTAKADATPTAAPAKKGDKKEPANLERKSEEKNGPSKDGGVKPPKKALKSEIDDIFSAGKKKAAEGKRAAGEAAGKEPDAAAVAAAAAAPAAKRPRVEGSKDDIFGEVSAKGRKRTEEGFPIYSEDELGLGKRGGDTDLCPFDCDCCF
ncbi:hypothetical protein PLESTB_000563400 [Pleodorina starrii]|uniref:DUF1764-domain-containing protein n=1 Tax=Pleodorina starrii TaxID=330485 RepID=A0A9W6BHK1_9CHLO|nr:hypothetical protein PLESTM_000288400 [Pleodorina starrii]GLC51923.1 hypothetical protein PLESTB_000563400 [Pleodorina starrii]GLC68498.1 hypothetical protein PLESTF_000698900 [Pleodorina starrii]